MTCEEIVPTSTARRNYGNVSKATWWRWEQRYPDFPDKIKIAGRNYYSVNALEAFLARRKQETADVSG